MSRKKGPAPVVEAGPDPYESGLSRTMADIIPLINAAEADSAVKKAAYKKYDKRELFYSMEKWKSLHRASEAAAEAPNSIRQKFLEGAVQAFLEDRPENIREIMAQTKEFRTSKYSPDNLIPKTLIILMDKSTDPAAVPASALEKIPEDQRQDILDSTLDTLVFGYTDIEKVAVALLEAGAKADGKILAAAIHRDAPAPVVDLLLKKGVTYDDAIQRMRDYPKYYGEGAGNKLALRLAQEKIRQLEETVRQLREERNQITGQPPEQVPAQPAAATESAPAEKEPVQLVPVEKVEPAQLVPAVSIPVVNPTRPRFRAMR
jgi:hypothetical protein